MAARLDTLEAIEAAVWQELAAAATTKTHPWRVAVLATTDGRQGQARSIVLREVDVTARSLNFYTDARSPKVAQLQAFPQGTLVMWSEVLGWQLRLTIELQLHTSGLAVASRWAKLKLSPAAQDYLSPLPPGQALAGPTKLERSSRNHFAFLTAQVSAIDWLELHADGHRRALFRAEQRSWLAP